MTEKVDLSRYHLLIATPMATGKAEDTYNTSLKETVALLEEHGAKCSHFRTKYISDIAYARAKLFSGFVKKKEFTHMIMIDDDMGWDAKDVAYMLMLQRDFIAGVGCKKIYPLEYAFNMSDDRGETALLYHEMETNVAEIPFVGGAFVMISRNCAEKLAESYPELEYFSPDKEIEYAVFDPIILTENDQKRRLSEDFAFCYRWRHIGGKVEVKMDIALTHTGSHTFKGNFLEYLKETNKEAFDG